MNILGIFLILIMPLAIGIDFNFITRQKKTNQIETYLIGFFSFFLLQGVIFSLYNFVNIPFETCCDILTYTNYGLFGLAIFVSIIGFKDYVLTDAKKHLIKKEELVSLIVLLIAIAVVVYRIISIFGYERDDIMLETVRINVLTNTVNTYNPLTGRAFELGLITSKKIITLPLLYTYWCMTYGIDARILLYIVCIIQTFVCVLIACRCAMTAVIKLRKKQYLCLFFVAVMLTSGDYFKGSIGYKILWNGYDGAAIIAAVMIVYVIYLVMDMYRLERGDYGKASWGQRIVRIFKFLICLASTLFITGLATGALMVILCLISMIVCATLRFGKEERA